MGDGIMAVFGAPTEQVDHADRALAAAQEMAGSALDEVNAWIRARGGEDFKIGIGLNAGPVMPGTSAASGGWSTRRSATPPTPPRGWRR
jgi:adenylate cyclase